MTNTLITCFNNSNIHSFTDAEGTLWFLGQDIKKALDLDKDKYNHELRNLRAYQALFNATVNVSESNKDEENSQVANFATCIERYPSSKKFDVTALGWNHQDIESESRKNTLTFVNEAGLYLMIFRAKTPIALAFQAFVCTDILPQIRKNGYYVSSQIDETQLKALNEQIEYLNGFKALVEHQKAVRAAYLNKTKGYTVRIELADGTKSSKLVFNEAVRDFLVNNYGPKERAAIVAKYNESLETFDDWMLRTFEM